jgi:hypothetical protein
VVWPDSKTGGISKPMSEEAYRLLSTAPRREAAPTSCRRPTTRPAPDLWRALWRLVPGAQGRRRPARRHARHPPPLDDRHCQFGRADQGGHEADGPQDRGDVHALRPHRGQAGARCGRTGGQPAPGHHGRAAALRRRRHEPRRSSAASSRSAFGAAGRHSGTDRGGAQARRLDGE